MLFHCGGGISGDIPRISGALANARRMHPSMLITCQCSHCGGKIQFPEEEFREFGVGPSGVTGQAVPCPHCRMRTVLFIPRAAARVAPGVLTANSAPAPANLQNGNGSAASPAIQAPTVHAKERRRQFYWFGFSLVVAGALIGLAGLVGLAAALKAFMTRLGAGVGDNLAGVLNPVYSLATCVCIVVMGLGLAAMGRWLMWKWVCTHCGNPLPGAETKLCPHCSTPLK